MKQMKKTVLNWSGGKDSAVALFHLLSDDTFSVELLLTTVEQNTGRVTMHGVRRELIERQSEALGIPVEFLELPVHPSMEAYRELFTDKMKDLFDRGFEVSAFGDIHLEDLKEYRNELLRGTGLKAAYPIWNMEPLQLTREFIEAEFKALLVCINREKLDESFLGAEFDHKMIGSLPDTVDPCGENGEFHSFVYDGPLFNSTVNIERGRIYKKQFSNPESDSEGKDKIHFDYLDIV
jgi:uncharacterized protein (TIGR00290 family)